MNKIKAYIECNKTGWYSVYIDGIQLPFGVLGEGNTAEEAKQDFLAVYQAMRQDHYEATGQNVEVEFEFVLDASAFLQQYKGIISITGLSHITGINKVQLSQYVCGRRHPSAKTQEKIKQSVISFADRLKAAFI